jgi:hypothetical protein
VYLTYRGNYLQVFPKSSAIARAVRN